MWMAFRELEANTRDEGGITTSEPREPTEGRTLVVVDHSDFDQAYEERASIFLPEGLRSGKDQSLQVIPGSSKNLFWRGLRVAELSKPTKFTYNFLDHMFLTEDRTLMFISEARAALALYLLKVADEDVIERIITTKEDGWEFNLDFDAAVDPSAAFQRVMARHPRGIFSTAGGYWSGYNSRSVGGVKRLSPLQLHPAPWKVDGDFIVDRHQQQIFHKPAIYSDDNWPRVAAFVVAKIDEEN